jgi:hypothetical protein
VTVDYPRFEFRYDVSNIEIVYYEERERIFEFIVNVCAIVGGVFALASLVDAIVH